MYSIVSLPKHLDVKLQNYWVLYLNLVHIVILRGILYSKEYFSLILYYLFLETGSPCVAEAILELAM